MSRASGPGLMSGVRHGGVGRPGRVAAGKINTKKYGWGWTTVERCDKNWFEKNFTR
jgi:hypothetical protein